MPPRKGATKANTKDAIADGAHVLDSNTTGGTGGPIRGGSTNRGGKRRRTSNNVNPTGTNDIYGGETIVASNPFDDDNHHHHHHHHHPIHHTHQPSMTQHQPNNPLLHQHNMQQQQQQQQQHQQQPNPQMHHQPQMHHHPHIQQPPSHMYHSMPNNVPSSTSPGSKMMVMSPSIQQQQVNQMHPVYSTNYMPHNQSQQQHPTPQQSQMSIPPLHSHPHNMANAPGQPIMNQDHLNSGMAGGSNGAGPPPHPQQAMHNPGSHMMPVGGHPQNFGPPTHLPQNQMIGTSTPPHMMGGGPAPSHSTYMHHQQQGQMLAPPQQVLTPQPTHLATNDQMLMHQQPYSTNEGVFCAKCQREIYQNEPNIICKAGCRACFHISCSGLTQLACDLLMRESMAEWACDRCTTGGRRVPFVKYKT